jgi:hypothetical protein
MKVVLGAIAMSAALLATEASAQGVNLTGRYRCMEGCVAPVPGQFAFITQNGWELNMVNEAGHREPGWIIRAASGSATRTRARSIRRTA